MYVPVLYTIDYDCLSFFNLKKVKDDNEERNDGLT